MWSQCVVPFFELMSMRNVWGYQLTFFQPDSLSIPSRWEYQLYKSSFYAYFLVSVIHIHIFKCKFLKRAFQKNLNSGFRPNLASLKKQINSIVSFFFPIAFYEDIGLSSARKRSTEKNLKPPKGVKKFGFAHIFQNF